MSSLKNCKVLVTGADGFIGSHLTEALVRQGYNVRAFVYYNSFNSWGWLDHAKDDVKSSIEVFAADVRDPNSVREAMRGCQVVFHLAALIGIPFSYIAPDSYIDTNIKGTLNILLAAKELGIQKVIHTSTSEVYGTARFVPITEAHPLQTQSPYAASKAAADHLALSFFQSFDTPVSIVRPFNTYGPRQSARAFIPTIISQIASGKSRIKLGSLTPTRDLNYVDDTVAGFIAAAQSDAAIGEVINIGNNCEISVGDTVKCIADLMKVSVTIESDESRVRPAKSEVERLWADNSKAKSLLNWNPRFYGKAGLAKGLESTIAWFTQSENLAQYKTEIYNI